MIEKIESICDFNKKCFDWKNELNSNNYLLFLWIPLTSNAIAKKSK